MNFDYSTYYQGCFVLPLFFSLIALFIMLPVVVSYIKQIKSRSVNVSNSLVFTAAILVFGFLVTLNGSRLLHGGIYLAAEREEDAITVIGEISDIRTLNRLEFPELRDSSLESAEGTTNGVQITIGQDICISILKGSFQIGDKVEVCVLPKSRYVLSINSVE